MTYTNRAIETLQFATTDMLDSQGYPYFAIQTDFCRWGVRCRQRYCAQCESKHALTAANKAKGRIFRAVHGYEAAIGSHLTFFSFSVKDDYVQLRDLRKTLDRMTRNLSQRISRQAPTILGSAFFVETGPALVDGQSIQEDHPHIHGVLVTDDPTTLLSLPTFLDEPGGIHGGLSKMNKAETAHLITYANKGRSDQFHDRWTADLQQPENFIPRIEALESFQSARYSGMFSDRLSHGGRPN
jgi:hypothetical protein